MIYICFEHSNQGQASSKTIYGTFELKGTGAKNNTAVFHSIMAQLVEAMCYKLEGRGFDSRWCHNFH
jgi:hypothetical protein